MPEPAPDETWLSTAQAAAYIHVGVRTLERWRAAGRGPAYYQLSPKMTRYRPQDIDDWLAASQGAVTHAISG